jgi:tetratricopeptide (TPR) repeat protein
LQDISSAVVYYKKAYLLDKNKDLTTYKKLENLLFAKGILSLEEGNLNIEVLKEIKTQMDKTHYYYLKYSFLLILRAVALLAVGHEKEAISKLQKIISINPNHVEGNLLLGKIMIHNDKYREGSQYLWKVNKLQPNHSEIQQYVSIMKFKMKDCLGKANQNILKKKEDMGLLWCSKALSIFPNHPEALILRSDIYKQMGKYKNALEDLNNAYLNMQVDNFTEKVLSQISITYNELALQLMSSKNYLEAYKVLEEALKFKSDDSFTHMYKGDCLLELKDLNKAKEEYLISYNINPKNAKIKTKIALINYKFAILSYNNREYKDCLIHIDRAISEYPSSCEFYLLRARSYLKLDQKSKAHEDIKMAYSINPTNKDAIELKKFINQ